MDRRTVGFQTQVWNTLLNRWNTCVKYVDENGFDAPYSQSTKKSVPANFATQIKAMEHLEFLLKNPNVSFASGAMSYRVVEVVETLELVIKKTRNPDGTITEVSYGGPDDR